MVDVVRLHTADLALARDTFAVMGEVFAEDQWTPLSDDYLLDLLEQGQVWAYAAVLDGRSIGGLTAHALPMTRAEARELLIYDLAVQTDQQRRGIGSALVKHLLADAASAGISEVWVPADNDDTHALDFYRRTGGTSQAVTIFTYTTH